MLTSSETKQKQWIFYVFLAAMLVHLCIVFCGFYNNDDINYARYAAGILHNGFSTKPPTDHFQLRWSTIFITSLFYKLFGINSFTSSLCAFFSTIACGYLLKKIVFHYTIPVYTLALAFFFLGHSILFYMHRLLPDALICFLVFWMYASYRAHHLLHKNAVWMACQFSAACLLCVITKEVIIIVLPLFALLFLKDVFTKRNLVFWGYAILFCAIGLIGYLYYFKITTGSYFYRYQLLQRNSYFSYCSFNQLPFVFTLKRIGYELWYAMLLNGDMLCLLPAIVACVYYKKLITKFQLHPIDFIAFAILLFAVDCMTISFTSYVPLCQDPRHFLFLFPFAALISAPLIIAYFEAPKKYWLLPFVFWIAFLITYFTNAGNTKWLYFVFACGFSAVFFIKEKVEKSIYTIAVIALLSLNYFIDILKPPYPYFAHHEKIINAYFRGKAIDATLYTADPLSAELTEFFLDFKKTDLKILPMDSLKNDFHPIGKIYFLVVRDLSVNAYQKAFDFSKMPQSNINQCILIKEEKNVALYEIGDKLLHDLTQILQ